MKQFVLIKWIFDGLARLSKEDMQQYDHIKAISYVDCFKEFITGNLDIRKPEGSLKVLKSMINQVLENFESQELKNAIQLLSYSHVKMTVTEHKKEQT